MIVGIDTDERVKASKGESRPFNNLTDRVGMLQAIRHIDKVVVFSTDHELDTQVLLSGAEIMVVGSDYRNKDVIGSRHVKDVLFFDKVGGHSTTKILAGLQ